MSDDNDKKAQEEEDALKRRKRVRTLILGTLAASGAFQLNGWQAQAHGNRSSHSASALRSDLFLPQDYITFRQQLTAPTAEETLVLSRLSTRMTTLRSSPGMSRSKTSEMRTLQRQIDTIADKLRLRETSRQTLEFIQQGDMDAAVAVIEGEGDPERVSYEYLWTITDLAYSGSKGNQLTSEPLAALTALSKRAMQYVDGARTKFPSRDRTDMERAVLVRMAEIYHNIASYMVPDVGQPTPEGLKLGYEAAQKAHALRVELDQSTEALIGMWTVANYEALMGNHDKATALHKEALAKAQAMNDPVQAAWNTYSLAKLGGVNVRGAAMGKVQSDIDDLLSRASPEDPAAALLRLEIESARRGA